MFRMINDQPATRGEENVVVCVQNIPNNLKVTDCSRAQFSFMIFQICWEVCLVLLTEL